MKKNGFTLSELIISLTVIGVASALMMPTITKLMPDKNKVKVSNIHAKIVDATNSLVDDDSIYWCIETEKDEGLSCDSQPRTGVYDNAIYSGSQKYENLMVYKLGLEASNAGAGFDWISPDGAVWRFERGCVNDNDAFTSRNNGACPFHNTLAYRITVDINGLNNGPDRIFGQTGEQKPDEFRFRVDNYGGVTPEDAMTAAYLINSFKSADKRNDRQVANEFLRQNARYRSF